MSEEFTGRYHDGWVSRRFVAPLRRVKKESVAIIKARRFPYPETLTLSVYVNGERVLVKKDPAGSFTMKVPIPPVRKGRLEILADQTFVPKEKGINDDVRKLSFLLDEIEIPGLQDAMEPFLYLFDFTPGKKVYFLDEDVWDEAAYRLPDAYRIPDRKMLEPLRDFANVKPNRNKRTIIRGFVYDKFENRKLTQAAVDLLNEHKRPIASAETNGEGEYKIKPPSPGTYFVRTRQHGYGDQVIAVRVRGHPLAIHVPMLPLQ